MTEEASVPRRGLSARRPLLALPVIVLGLLALPGPAPAQEPAPTLRKAQFVRGDGNADALVDIADAIHGLAYLFQGIPEPPCLAALDSNGDGRPDVSDAVHLLGFLFLGTSPPPAPGPEECGVDPAEGGLSCRAYPHCPDDFPLIAHVLGRITFGGTEELYRRIQTRADLVRYIEEQLEAPAAYDAAVHEPAVHAHVEALGIGHDRGGTPAEQSARLKASVLVPALESRWQLLQVVARFWENHFHTQLDALRENFFSRGGRGGPALQAQPEIFRLADADSSGLISQAEWEAFRALHPGLISWEEFRRQLGADGMLSPDEFNARGQIAFWKYGSNASQVGIAAEMERREGDFFRRGALGRFRDLLEGSAKGVPMLIYLNGFENTARAPNENYAREVLELFGLGADHSYVQRDIEQLSRLLTGWSVGWVPRAPFDASDRQFIGHPELRPLPINLREPRPLAVPTQEYWEDELYTWAFVIDPAAHDWGRKDIFLRQYGAVDSLGSPHAESARVQVPENTANRTAAAALAEFDLFLERLVSFRDCRKLICGKLIQLLVTDDLGALAREGPVPPEVRAAFDAVDADRDGSLSSEEWEEPIPLVLPAGRPPELFHSLDRDGDGQVTLSEYREPDLLLAAMARWDETGGDIRAVLRAVLLSDEFLSLRFQAAKVKTPLEGVTSTLRILGASATDAQLKVAAEALSQAGMDLFQFADPTGESEMGFDWMHTIGLLERIGWISQGAYPERAAVRTFAWSPAGFIDRHRLEGRERIADFFIRLIHPHGVAEHDRALALEAYDLTPAARVEALASFLLTIPPAMKQ